MLDWKPTKQDLKNYPHFDAPISLNEIENIVKSPIRVAQNPFYPFLRYFDEWQPFRSQPDGKPDKKSRPIRYASRRDAYVFAYYRHLLSQPYERRLDELGISECPIAYRHIPFKVSRGGGKCNIDFAKDAFDGIERLGNCVAIALDIEKYFERLDHSKIYSLWCELLGVERLPRDHHAVFKNITQYRYVDQKEAYRRLGFLTLREKDGQWVEGYTIPFRKMPKQLCTTKEFQQKICGNDPTLPSIIKKNEDGFGIPQGAPISDLIANFYLMYFDKDVADYVRQLGGCYMRYSDDILLILPGNHEVAHQAKQFVTDKIRLFGDNLFIKEKKTCIVQFQQTTSGLTFKHIEGQQGKNGLEYLGFRFDGRRVYLRESTISRFYRKVSISARRDAKRHVADHPSKDVENLLNTFNYSTFSERYSRVRDFEKYSDNYSNWTFWSYVKRAANTFRKRGNQIPKQVSGFHTFMRTRIENAIRDAHIRQNSMRVK